MSYLSSSRIIISTNTMLAIVLILHASEAHCQVAHVVPAKATNTPPAQYSGVYVDPSQTTTSSSIYYDIENTPRPSFSAPLDEMIVDEEGTIITTTPKQLDSPALGTQGWFTQIDSYSWQESFRSSKLLEETGPLVTFGYQARKPNKRYRIALFGGSIDYDGCYISGNRYKRATSNTDYFGATLVNHDDSRFARGLPFLSISGQL